MERKRNYSFSPRTLICAWFVCLLIAVVTVHLLGPAATKIALLSVTDGMSMTYESIYFLAVAIAIFLTLTVVQWCIGGIDSIFELERLTRSYEEDKKWSVFRTVIIGAYGVVALLTCYFTYVCLNKTLICQMLHDAFVYCDGAHRMAEGQRQHIDFHTPMGLLCNVFPYLGLKAAGGYAGALEWAGLIAGSSLFIVGLPVLATRLTVSSAAPLVVYFCLLSVVPLGVEDAPNKVGHAMFYNRLGWVAITLVLLYFLEPRVRSKAVLVLDCVCLSASLLFLLYLKASYFLVGAGFLPLLCVTSSYNRRIAIISAILVAFGIGMMEYIYNLNAPYLNDLYMTIKASGANRGSMIPKFFSNIKEFILVAAAAAFTWNAIKPKWPYILYTVFVSLAGLAIIDQNTHSNGVICLLAALIISEELIRRSINCPDASDIAIRVRRFKAVACLGMVVLFTIQPVVSRATTMALIRSAVTQVAVTRPGGLQGMLFPEDLWTHFCYGKIREPNTKKIIPGAISTSPHVRVNPYVESILDGLALLDKSETKGKQLCVFDFVDPFSFILNMRPSDNGHTCMVYGRTLNDNVVPPPAELLGSIDYVMVPRVPIESSTSDFLVKTYDGYLKDHFQPAEKSGFWQLWTRRETSD